MGRVFKVFPVQLRPGVSVEEFERFLVEDWVEVMLAPGVKSYVLRGNRGVDVGRYRMVIEFDRVETRDLYFTPEGDNTALLDQLRAQGFSAPEATRSEERWAALVTPDWAQHYTDWELVAE